MSRKHFVVPGIALLFLLPPASDVEGQLGRGRQERLQDRVERRVERQLNRSQRGFYFNDATWTEVEPWFQQYQIGPVRVETQVAGDVRYGFADQTPDDDWFYDWYDYGYSWYYPAVSNRAAYGWHYYDNNRDGIYDGYSLSYDRDNDGQIDTLDEFQFGVAAETRRQPESKDAPAVKTETMTTFYPPYTNDAVEISGEVVAIKRSQVRDTEHLLLEVRQSGEQSGNIVIDAGPTSEIEVQISVGNSIRATGRNFDVGDKVLFVATNLAVDDQAIKINRHGKPLSGRIIESRTVTVQGTPHVMAIIQAGNEHRVVDLGPEAELKVDFQPETEITVYGVPVQFRDRPVFMAHQVEYDGRELTIMRSFSEEGGEQRR